MRIVTFIKDFWHRIFWKFDFKAVGEICVALAIYPAVKYFDPEWFKEDAVIENLQIILLIGMFFICLRAPYEKKFFGFCACIVLFLIMRETNLGRSYFCNKYLEEGISCRWKNLKYGSFVEIGRILFGGLVVIYAIYYRLWRVLWRYIMQAPIYIWDIFAVILGAFLGTIAEFSSIDNEILEECGEMLAYIGLACCLWCYSHYKIE